MPPPSAEVTRRHRGRDSPQIYTRHFPHLPPPFRPFRRGAAPRSALLTPAQPTHRRGEPVCLPSSASSSRRALADFASAAPRHCRQLSASGGVWVHPPPCAQRAPCLGSEAGALPSNQASRKTGARLAGYRAVAVRTARGLGWGWGWVAAARVGKGGASAGSVWAEASYRPPPPPPPPAAAAPVARHAAW